MKTLEIIHVRLVSDIPQNLVEIIREYIGAESGKKGIRIYRHMKLPNDLAVHLMRESDIENSGASDIGIRLVALLKDFGMVSHSVWSECGSSSGAQNQKRRQGEKK